VQEEMGKEAAAAESSSTVVLAVNSKRYETAGVAPSTSLLEFLRTHTPVRGPKLGCGEGTYVGTTWSFLAGADLVYACFVSYCLYFRKINKYYHLEKKRRKTHRFRLSLKWMCVKKST
jgi:aerobic-type carbon monoxide dehydrogenase small subunit (CoxS/CutS family)